MKNKKLIILSVASIFIVMGIIWFIIGNANNSVNDKIEKQEQEGTSALTEIYEKLLNSSYTFRLILNDENQMTVSKKDNRASVEIIDEGEKNTYLVKDGNTYIIVENTKEYYEYQNNTSYLTQITDNMRELMSTNYTTGREKIDNKEYIYEEFNKTYPFILNYKSSINQDDTKTRLYFEGNNLKYIKTYVGEVQQLLKVDISYNKIDDNKFEIPQDYKEG